MYMFYELFTSCLCNSGILKVGNVVPLGASNTSNKDSCKESEFVDEFEKPRGHKEFSSNKLFL